MALPPLNDTIAAIATAPGVGAVGIIRLSGRDAYSIADNLFKPRQGKCVKDLPPGRVVYGQIMDAANVIDEALLLTFRAPHSYTAQDVLELQTHGGPAVLREVLELCVKHGARLAQPGEFTLRAYLNGRLDLVQAESVLQLVNAQSDSARRNATLGLSKALTEQLNLIQSDITRVYGSIQAMFDYPDEGVPDAEFAEPLQRAVRRIDELLVTAKAGQIAQKGAKLALIGKPNAGKSSLLNALLGYQRSIVSEIPGTTRDYLEAPLAIDGIPITATDTAGLRNTEDVIEAAGVKVARDIAANADLTLYLIDSHEELSYEDLEMLNSLDKERLLVVSSKSDLQHVWSPETLVQKVYSVSAVTSEGLPELKSAIKEKLLGDVGSSQLWITSERHAEALQRSKDFLLQAMNTSDDLAALDLEQALKALADITGRGEIAEETLEHIFANFCVGK
ncbi:MAG: tRNA uridine-5-carboxymethylaminomethyl(34) synthesis GTPase MnmE [Trueperaceae bacterium]